MSHLSSPTRGKPEDLADRLRQRLAAYLHMIDDVMEKEFRPARLQDLRLITPNLDYLKSHLDVAERDLLIKHLWEKGEHHYIKTEMGREMEEVLLAKWPYINILDKGWHGPRMRRE